MSAEKPIKDLPDTLSLSDVELEGIVAGNVDLKTLDDRELNNLLARATRGLAKVDPGDPGDALRREFCQSLFDSVSTEIASRHSPS